jgi:hypothetical protein
MGLVQGDETRSKGGISVSPSAWKPCAACEAPRFDGLRRPRLQSTFMKYAFQQD